MEYKFLKSAFLPKACRSDKFLYIIPLSPQAENYGVIYPEDFDRNLFNPSYYEHLKIGKYQGCGPEALENVRNSIKNIIRDSIKQHAVNLRNIRLLGLVLIGLGCLDFFLPDPIPLLDELLILAGGSTLVSSWVRFKNVMTVLTKNVSQILNTAGQLTAEDNPLCTAIYRAVCAEAEHNSAGRKINLPADTPEAETGWFTPYLDLEDLVKSDKRILQDLQHIISGVKNILPLRELDKRDKKLQQAIKQGKRIHKLAEKTRSFRKAAAENSGFSEDALTVYRNCSRLLQQYPDEMRI